MELFYQLMRGDQTQNDFVNILQKFVVVKIIQMELHVQSGASTLHVTPKWRDAGRYF